MKFVNLKQGTPAWLAWRKEGIGGSDVPVIMGVSPYGSAHRLWEVKTNLRQPDEANYAMRRGSRKEPTVIEHYQERTGNIVSPCCIEHESIPWMRASLDGMDLPGNVIVEGKCLKKEYHREAMDGKIPQHVMPQIQHQLYVSAADVCHYASWSEHKDTAEEDMLIVLEVKPDEEFIERMLEAEREFWRMVEAKEWVEKVNQYQSTSK